MWSSIIPHKRFVKRLISIFFAGDHLLRAYATFSEKLAISTPGYTQVFAYQEVRSVSFSKTFAHVLNEWTVVGKLVSIKVVMFNPSRPKSGRRGKIKLKFYFRFSLWCLKRFYEGRKGLCKTFGGTKKKCENKKFYLIFISTHFLEIYGTLRVKTKNSSKTGCSVMLCLLKVVNPLSASVTLI